MTLEENCTDPKSKSYTFLIAHPELMAYQADITFHPQEEKFLQRRGFQVLYDQQTNLPLISCPDSYRVELGPPGKNYQEGELSVHTGSGILRHDNPRHPQSNELEALAKQIEVDVLVTARQLRRNAQPISLVVRDLAWQGVIDILKTRYKVTEYQLKE